MALKSTGRTRWDGDLFNGSGTTSLDSGAAEPMRVTWKARAEDHGGLTSPEELMAAAHASCYSMALSNTLAKNDTPSTSLDVQATATFVPGEGITSMELEVKANVEGISAGSSRSLPRQRKTVVRCLRGNVPISLVAALA